MGFWSRMCSISLMDEGPKIAVLADEDVEEDPDRWCSHTECGQELWQIACQWVWNLRLSLGKAMQGGAVREIEWAPPKAAPAYFVAEEPPPEEYGPWQWAAAFGRATGRFGAEAFVLQEDGKLRCPAGANLWLSEVRQENAFTQRAVYLAYQTDCQRCALREQCLASGAKGDRARRVSAVRRLLPAPAVMEHKPIVLGSMRWVEHFAVPGLPTGVGNTLRSFPWVRPSRRPSLLLVHPVLCVHITAGVGRTGSPAMPGSDHRNCVSLSLAFPLFWP